MYFGRLEKLIFNGRQVFNFVLFSFRIVGTFIFLAFYLFSYSCRVLKQKQVKAFRNIVSILRLFVMLQPTSIG